MTRKKVLILGAAGRDFHNFNVYYRNNENYEVVGFTATQIPQIDGRTYPPVLAGELYPKGIQIYSEDDMEKLIKDLAVEEVVIAYSDLPHNTVMNLGSRATAAGADFRILGPDNTMVKSTKPVISICAVRTGCGKSQTTRYISDILKANGLKTVAIRHPMPYGDLAKQAVQRFADYADLDKHNCTIEEREEYESHIDMGNVVYAGVDYEAILRQAEQEADVILWDGGNNDWPFYKSDLEIVVADPFRPGHESTFFPGETNFRRAQIIIINKASTAKNEDVVAVEKAAKDMNPSAVVIRAASEVTVENPELVKGKKVLIIEDGPTLTHGGMAIGAGFVAAQKYEAGEIIDPRPFAKGSILAVFNKYSHLGKVLPAMGYYPDQLKDLEDSINGSNAESVVSGTPIDLTRILKVSKPMTRVRYELKDMGDCRLSDHVNKWLSANNLKK
ncbi:cyclic 2,3-diphosphoglycerate synthase [Myxococcota bacterium]|nr:cyclic 2,3-diphosphoglycerate synthase [Myxococcota bacterium]MBU1380541.1 cyclic 2,3-diphosphoglycerate synthase [Myxococcota bacterium]MBU1497312.1 cyclic 2,3-diphosphoglycerate synthase [Myxococcota bacterium]